MSKLGALWLVVLLFLGNAAGSAAADHASAGGSGSPADSGLVRALMAARDAPGGPFHLRVDRAEKEGFRSLEVFPSGVAIWNGRFQITLATKVRVALLETLIRRDFPAFEASYGGRQTPGLREAALRIICRVVLDIDGHHKSSIQLAEGERSPELGALARELLDLVEPLAAAGIAAEDLGDGLAKVAAGKLAPETFGLRFVQLPAPGRAGTGSILRVEAGAISRWPYAPGRTVGEVVTRHLERRDLVALVSAIQKADPQTLPVNLWSDAYLELEVRVLQHRRTVMARPFSRLAGRKAGDPQRRFDRLVEVLQKLEAEIQP